MDCNHKLSPEAYLRYPVESTPQTHPSDTPLVNSPRVFPYRFRPINTVSIRIASFVNALRSARLQTIEYPDMEYLKTSNDVVEKYCVPVAHLMNTVVLQKEVPELQLLCSDKSALDTRYPTALFVCGTQGEKSSLLSIPQELWHKGMPSNPLYSNSHDPFVDWSRFNKCFTVVTFMPPGSIRSEQICYDEALTPIFGSPEVQYAFVTLTTLMNKTNSLFGILTDETTSIGVDCRKADGYKTAALLFVDSTTKFELRVLIATCIYEGAQRWRMIRLYTDPPLQWVLGALYDSDVLNRAVSNMDLQGRRWFADFDLYTMQRVPELWYRFHQWREDVQEAGLKNPLTAGSTLRFEPHGFERHSGLQRSPYPFFPIPLDTVAIIKGGRPSRTRNRTLDNVLGSCEEVSLTIVEVKRAAPGQFSQVFFGRVEGCDEVVCVKLFDERYFPIPEVDDFESISGPPQTRLGSLNFSGDLAMREEAVYNRLKDLQGGLLPFCYGFHLFTLPDGWQCYGVILERIPGSSLGESSATYPIETQMSLVKQIRHGVRALRAAGISQTDWHSNQVLCVPRNEHDVDVVFIDFAFALIYLGDEAGLPTRTDLMGALGMVIHTFKLDDKILDNLWDNPLEYEY